MSPPPHLRLFTSAAGSAEQDSERHFTLFSLLPKELRLQIWRHSLETHRLIKVGLREQAWGWIAFVNNMPTYTEKKAKEVVANSIYSSPDKSVRYYAVVDGYQVLSKLLRVNSEARQAALSFYRAHVPCVFSKETPGLLDDVRGPGTFYFNPEYDFLQINIHEPPFDIDAVDALADFLYHLKKTYDPQGAGLLNLALGYDALCEENVDKFESSLLDPGPRAALLETLTQLREVFFAHTELHSRQMINITNGGSASQSIYNRSCPLMPHKPTFRRLHRDPRPIGQDLTKTFIRTNKLQSLQQLWSKLLKRCDILTTQTEYRLLLASGFSGRKARVYDQKSAKRWLREEEELWRDYKRRRYTYIHGMTT
ncbi:hypothetical protein GQ43DRAFT_467800 [Delitschia confertaspora ATCC 74209]|uniref:2EXR domain-containing protein n=1 Tax=Delitschia confertaspora ATCC 74209 TaxID=1513339 RepID=A0A9P4N3H2_9PLEO|nr:hypothetical protein GQ43DRAFT_467800 [Delitschia confertaspora ATCC 74209]